MYTSITLFRFHRQGMYIIELELHFGGWQGARNTTTCSVKYCIFDKFKFQYKCLTVVVAKQLQAKILTSGLSLNFKLALVRNSKLGSILIMF